MTRQAVQTFQTIYIYRRGVSMAIVAVILFMSSLYVYSIVRTVTNGMELASINKQITETKRSISDLDAQFLTKEKKVTIDLAHARGFVATDVSLFIDEHADKGLSFNNDR